MFLLQVTFVVVVEMLLYVHRNRRFIRDGSPGRPPRLSHSSWALQMTEYNIQYTLLYADTVFPYNQSLSGDVGILRF